MDPFVKTFYMVEAGVDSFVYTRETLLDRVTLFDAGGTVSGGMLAGRWVGR